MPMTDHLHDCLTLCALPIGSPERNKQLKELLGKWPASTIWKTIEENAELFEWSVSVQGARLTVEGREMLRKVK
jgi:hypothetical protein